MEDIISILNDGNLILSSCLHIRGASKEESGRWGPEGIPKAQDSLQQLRIQKHEEVIHQLQEE